MMIAQHNHEQHSHSLTSVRHPLWLLAGFWFCVVVSVAVVLRRLVELVRASQTGTSPLAEINATFSSHAALTTAHILPAALFVILAIGVLLRPERGKWWNRLFFLSGAITGTTAYAMSFYAIGGWIERSAVFVFGTWFLLSLGRAYFFWRRGEPARKRAWTTRAVGILLGIATTRPVMGVFFATSTATHLSPNQFFGIAFWIGFSINAVVIELWLHSKQRVEVQKGKAVVGNVSASAIRS